jgi:hypothetical protein
MVVVALALASCSGKYVGTSPPAPGTPPPAPSKVKQMVLQGCGYVTTAENIAAVITASPFVPAAGAVAEAICQAATNIPFADGPGDHLPRVNGVIVRGYFVRK